MLPNILLYYHAVQCLTPYTQVHIRDIWSYVTHCVVSLNVSGEKDFTLAVIPILSGAAHLLYRQLDYALTSSSVATPNRQERFSPTNGQMAHKQTKGS